MDRPSQPSRPRPLPTESRRVTGEHVAEKDSRSTSRDRKSHRLKPAPPAHGGKQWQQHPADITEKTEARPNQHGEKTSEKGIGFLEQTGDTEDQDRLPRHSRLHRRAPPTARRRVAGGHVAQKDGSKSRRTTAENHVEKTEATENRHGEKA